MASEEVKTAITTLARIGGGAAAGACAGALAGTVISALMLARFPHLNVSAVAQAHLGNGAVFGAIAGSVIGPIVAAGPLDGIPLRRWAPPLILGAAVCADAGYFLGNLIDVRAAINTGALDVSRIDLWAAVLLLPEPAMGLMWAMIAGVSGVVVVSLYVRARESRVRRALLQ